MALKESQRLERELTGYVDWICRAGGGLVRKMIILKSKLSSQRTSSWRRTELLKLIEK